MCRVSNSEAQSYQICTLDIIQCLSLDIIQSFGYYSVTPIGYYSLLWILFRHAFGYCSGAHIGYYSVPKIFGYYSAIPIGYYSVTPLWTLDIIQFIGYYSVISLLNWILFCHPPWILFSLLDIIQENAIGYYSGTPLLDIIPVSPVDASIRLGFKKYFRNYGSLR